MADWELAEERILSGKGILKIADTFRPIRQAILYADLVRPPLQRYQNLEWNPARSMYARITFCRDDYVLNAEMMEFSKSAWEVVSDVCGQTLLAVKCGFETVTQNFIRLANAGGLAFDEAPQTILDFTNLRLGWDTVKVACYKDTAIRLQLWVLRYDSCNPEYDDEQPKPPEPNPIEPVPPGIPIGSISPPYDDGTNDDGDSIPYSGDEFEDPLGLPGVACLKYRVTIRHNQNYGTPTIERTADVYGTVTGVRIVPSGGANALQLNCRGWAIPSLDIGCQAQNWLTIFVSDSVALTPDPEIIAFTAL